MSGPCAQASGGGAPEGTKKSEEGKEEAVVAPVASMAPWARFPHPESRAPWVVPLKEVRTGSFSGAGAQRPMLSLIQEPRVKFCHTPTA